MGTRLLWRIVDWLVGGLFVFAGLAKIVDLDPLIHDTWHLKFADLILQFQHLQLGDPVGFANDIDNYKAVPWTMAVALAFYLPWLEILCGIALILRRVYLGGLAILTGLLAVFIVASLAAKARGIDITCGCFGHISKDLSFTWHMLLDFAILAALLILCWQSRAARAGERPLDSAGDL